MAAAIEDDCEAILRANIADLNAVRSTMSDVMLDRLALNAERVHSMSEGFKGNFKTSRPL